MNLLELLSTWIYTVKTSANNDIKLFKKNNMAISIL